MLGKSVKLRDVAALAGVSLATASKALNGEPRVGDETRARIISAARSLGYSRTPRELEGSSGTVGLLTSDLEGRFSLPILMGAEDTLGAGQLSVFLCDARGDTIRERHYISALLSRRVDAIMVVGSRTDPRPPIAPELDLPVPVVYVYTPSLDPRDHSIVTDNVAGGRLAAEHLIAIGRRRIAHVTGPPNHRASIDRRVGVLDALAKQGMTLVFESDYGEWNERWGRSATAMLIERGEDFDAVLCDSDQIARGALDALKERGIDVPRQVAVTGFDNWDLIVESTNPMLTSIEMSLEAMGRLAAERLFGALRGKPLTPGVDRQPCRLIVRSSTYA